MEEAKHQAPGIGTLAGRLFRTGMGAVQNRVELFAIEWQEERLRLTELLIWAVGLVCFGMMALLLITATVIFLCEKYRVYVAAAFAVLYLSGAVFAWLSVRALLKREPFADTIDQAKKDKEWLKSLD